MDSATGPLPCTHAESGGPDASGFGSPAVGPPALPGCGALHPIDPRWRAGEDIGGGARTAEVARSRSQRECSQRTHDVEPIEPLEAVTQERPTLHVGCTGGGQHRHRRVGPEVRDRSRRTPDLVHLTLRTGEPDHHAGSGPLNEDVAGVAEAPDTRPTERAIQIGGHRPSLHGLDRGSPSDRIGQGPERFEVVVHEPACVDVEISDPLRTAVEQADDRTAPRSLERQLARRLPTTDHRDALPAAHLTEVDVVAVHHDVAALDPNRVPPNPRIACPHDLAGPNHRAVGEFSFPADAPGRPTEGLHPNHRGLAHAPGEAGATDQLIAERLEGSGRGAAKGSGSVEGCRSVSTLLGMRPLECPHERHLVRIRVVHAGAPQHVDLLAFECPVPGIEPRPRGSTTTTPCRAAGSAQSHRARTVKAWGPAPTTSVSVSSTSPSSRGCGGTQTPLGVDGRTIGRWLIRP